MSRLEESRKTPLQEGRQSGLEDGPQSLLEDDRQESIYGKISEVLLGRDSLEAILTLVSHQAKETVAGAEEVSVTLAENHSYRTASYTGEWAKRLDEIQYSVDQGPCLDASKTGEVFEIESVSSEMRWPNYVEKAITEGLMSSLSMPLLAGGRSVGALNIYSSNPSAFSHEAKELASDFAGQAGVLLANAVDYMEKDQLTTQLREGLETREMIGKVLGILMEREGITDEEAFTMLRKASQESNIKIRDIAAEFLRRAAERAKSKMDGGAK